MRDELDSKLKQAAERAIEAPVSFSGFFPVVETFRGDVIWEGVVSLFESDFGYVYAWAVEGDPEPQFVAVLQRPPVLTPLDAVRAWMVMEGRKK